jgi:hypothetical protein
LKETLVTVTFGYKLEWQRECFLKKSPFQNLTRSKKSKAEIGLSGEGASRTASGEEEDVLVPTNVKERGGVENLIPIL